MMLVMSATRSGVTVRSIQEITIFTVGALSFQDLPVSFYILIYEYPYKHSSSQYDLLPFLSAYLG